MQPPIVWLLALRIGIARASAALLVSGCAFAFGLSLMAPALGQYGGGAQFQVCRQIEYELANLPRGGGSSAQGAQYARAAQRLRAQLAQVRGQMAASGCPTGGFTLFAPAHCSSLRAQAQAISAQISDYDGAAQASAGAGRRQQLQAAYDRAGCRNLAAAPRPRNPLEALFGGPRLVERNDADPRFPRGDPRFPPGSSVILDNEPIEDPYDGEREDAYRPRGGGMPVCVRTCDGYYFPVNYEGARASDAHEALCKAHCPAAETRLFFMRPGGDVNDAVDAGGEPYSALPGALKYRSAVSASCACRAAGQTWAQVHANGNDILGTRQGDTIVTPEQSAQSARPQILPPLRGTKPAKPGEKTLAAAPAGENAPPARGKSRNARSIPAAEPALAPLLDTGEPPPTPIEEIPTAGTQSAGIGPKLPDLAPAQPQATAPAEAGDARRRVRVVAPELRPGQGAAAAP